MQQMQRFFLKCVRIFVEPVVFVQAARLDTHNFCSPGLELHVRFREVHDEFVILLLSPREFFPPKLRFVHLSGKRSGVLNQKIDRLIDFFWSHGCFRESGRAVSI
jgi:hypothetical protein